MIDLEEKAVVDVEFRDSIVKLLKEKIMVIHFTKKNNEQRSMRCTLKFDLLPQVKKKKPTEPKPTSEEVLKVYDLDKQGWRSIILDTIHGFEESVA